MSAQSLFTLLLKLMGIYFIKDLLEAIPGVVGILFTLATGNNDGAGYLLAFTLPNLILHGLLIYMLVFNTQVVIDKLHLVEQLPEDPIPLPVHRSTLVTLAVLITGLVATVFGLANLVSSLADWWQAAQVRSIADSPNSNKHMADVLGFLAQVLGGLWLATHAEGFANYIALKMRKRI
ncbi:MAG TPA: hypothetical protein PKD90_07430 [Phnomibacter sp.]|nr:hypothetical protein [Phnomibacter sp.]